MYTFRIIYTLFFVVFLHHTIFSQNVNKNSVDSTLNHVVQKGETSYGITKKYNIDINLFYEYNPDAIKGLKKDMVLIIPFISTNPTDLDTNSFIA